MHSFSSSGLKSSLSPAASISQARMLCLILLFLGFAIFQPLDSQAGEKGSTTMVRDSEITIHYHRFSGDYQDWQLWCWSRGSQDGRALKASGNDEFGLIFRLKSADFASGSHIGILPRLPEWRDKDNPERWLAANRASGPLELWMVSEDPQLHDAAPDISPRIIRALAEKNHTVTLVLTGVQNFSADQIPCLVDHQGRLISLAKAAPIKIQGHSRYPLFSAAFPGLSGTELNRPGLSLRIPGFKDCPLWFGDLYKSPEYYSNLPMGCLRDSSGRGMVFRIFAPQAWRVSLCLYPDQGRRGARSRREMQPAGRGIWEVTMPDDPDAVSYTYGICDALGEREFIDPYATLVSSDGTAALIRPLTAASWPCSQESPSPAAAQEPQWPMGRPTDLVVYELHVRDFTVSKDSGATSPGTFAALGQAGCSLRSQGTVRTGLDHLEELGVNAVQLMPIQDFRGSQMAPGSYNWGYMPVHYNSVETWFGTSSSPAQAIDELKKTVSALHSRGILVIMDVVYNHTSEGSLSQRVNFNGASPGYYYRTWEDGSLANGSGCGNEFDSQAPMARKFILDSMSYWVREFDIDGFRMDLMGLTDQETLETLARELRKVKPGLFLYGEPWAASETPVKVFSKGCQKNLHIGVFNDHFRDSLRGSVWDSERGFISSLGNEKFIDQSTVQAITAGSLDLFAAMPEESINYVAVHDNRTLIDRIRLTLPKSSPADQERMARLAMTILLTSQGVPVIHSGMEMLRSKKGEHNSYNCPDSINQIDWPLKEANMATFRYMRDLISLRKAHPLFRQWDPEMIRKNLRTAAQAGVQLPDRCLGWSILGQDTNDTWKEVIVIVNPFRKKIRARLPQGKFFAAQLGDWSAGASGDTPEVPVPANLEIPSLTSAILYRK